MSLAPGTRFGPYEVLAPLGAGGMGEVYRARDTQLRRDVALKVLPLEVSMDAERLARFQREAELLAALNHPRIAQIYGVAEAPPTDGTVEAGPARGVTRALVMELVEGPTLAERIAGGPLSVAEALPLARQIAEALEYAHERAIVHRDLKPGNITLTPDGAVKILDFGLAKGLEGSPAAGALSDSPTITSPAMTRAGVILGTAAYMSPEQARGAVVDRRADVWAFGVVLFEMLAGRQCFTGETVTDVLAAVVRAEPDWTSLPDGTPPRVLDLLKRCLAKDRRQRLHDIGDARLEIEGVLSPPDRSGTVAAVSPAVGRHGARMPTRERIAWITAALALLLFAVAVVPRRSHSPGNRSAGAPPAVRYTFSVPPDTALTQWNAPALAVAPDGLHVVVAVTQGEQSQLYIRALDGLSLQPIPGTEGATMPFFSPDGQWIGFLAGTLLRKVPLNGGAATTVCFGGAVRGASWGADGWIVFTPALRSGLSRVRADGGIPEEVTSLDRARQEKTHRFPHALPGARGVVFASATGDVASYDDSNIVAWRSKTGGQVILVRGGMAPQYVESGHIVFARAGAIYAVPFDIERLAVKGQAVKVISGVRTGPSDGVAEFCVSPSGTLAYVAGGPVGEDGRIIQVDRQGRERPLLEAPGPYILVRLSPDGHALAVERTMANEELWVYDLDRGSSSRFASGWDNQMPVWTPDGLRLVFGSNRLGTDLLFTGPVDGSAPPRTLSRGDVYQYPLDISPDGRTLVYQETEETGSALWRLSLEGEANPRLLVQNAGSQGDARISPDGRWLAYESNESGRREICVRPFPGPGGRLLVSAGGGYSPRWTRGGRELIYSAPDYSLMTVAMTLSTPPRASRPQRLWDGRPRRYQHYDVSADGERFVLAVPGPSKEPPREVTVVVNWAEELKRLAPPAR